MKLKKDKKVITLTNEIQIDAYKNAGWIEVNKKETEANEQSPEPEATPEK